MRPVTSQNSEESLFLFNNNKFDMVGYAYVHEEFEYRVRFYFFYPVLVTLAIRNYLGKFGEKNGFWPDLSYIILDLSPVELSVCIF